MQARSTQVYVDPALIEYSVRLAVATRRPDEVGLAKIARYVTFGASPRASINLVLAARALAFIRGRDYTLPHDLTDLALDVFRHRLVLSYEALADDVTADTVLTRVHGLRCRCRTSGRRRPLTVTGRVRPSAARLEWQVIRRLDGQLQGAYRTVFRGTGIDFADLRELHPGRRRTAHRLERDRPAGRAVRAAVHARTAT